MEQQFIFDRKKRMEEKKLLMERKKNELVRRSKLFIEDFTDHEYRACRDYCRETFRMVLDLVNTMTMQLSAKERRIAELEQALVGLGAMDAETKRFTGNSNAA